MNFKGLRAFTRIMATGALNTAAKSMNISESALSRQLSLLEAELGLTLFSREKRRLSPTPEGEAFYHEAERILEFIEQIPDIINDIKKQPRRRMRIIVMPRMVEMIAVPAVAQFLDEQPNVEMTIEVQPRRFLERWVATQQFDLGLGALPTRHSAIETEHICSTPAVAVLHPEHALASRRSLRVEELADERFVVMPHSTLLGTQVARIFDAAGIEPKSPIQVSNSMLCCNFVKHGFGIAITDAMMPQVFGSAVRIIPIEPRVNLGFGLLYPRGVERTKETLRLAEIIRTKADTFVGNLDLG